MIIKKKFKWSPIPSISTKHTTTSHLISLNTKMTKTCDVENSGPVLEQAQQCGGVKLVNVDPRETGSYFYIHVWYPRVPPEADIAFEIYIPW
jgi:hypothetical protein